MRAILLTIGIMCSLFSVSKAQNESTFYFFMGSLYTSLETDQYEFYPYLTVLLSKESDPNNIVAATMTDPRGEFGFKGVPIDCEKNYLFTVLMPNGTKRVFRYYGAKLDYPSGNLNTNICLDGGYTPVNYYTNSLSITDFSDAKNESFINYMLRKCDIESEDGNYYRKSDDGVIIPFIERWLDAEMLKKLMEALDADDVSSVNLIELTQPNDYFAGAIHITVPALHKQFGHHKPNVYSPLKEVK